MTFVMLIKQLYFFNLQDMSTVTEAGEKSVPIRTMKKRITMMLAVLVDVSKLSLLIFS